MSFAEFAFNLPIQFYDRWVASSNDRFQSLADRTGEEDVTNKIVVITGANAGLGKCVAMEMAKRAAIVVMCCRNVQKTEATVDDIKRVVPQAELHVFPLDLANLDSVRSCASSIVDKLPYINILINNAGMMTATAEIERTAQGHERHLGTNHLGHMLFTMLLLDHLKRGSPSRIVCLGSLLHAISTLHLDDLNWEQKHPMGFLNFAPYNDSKRCCMLFARELGRRLEGTNVRTYTVCPGMARTEITDDFPLVAKLLTYWYKVFIGCTVEQGASAILNCALGQSISDETGQAYHYRRLWTYANQGLSLEEAASVWQESEKLLGVSFEKYFTPTTPQFIVKVKNTDTISDLETYERESLNNIV